MSVIRRDPRKEWILRNRLHPEHGAMMSQDAIEVLGPNGIVRKYPHKVGFIGPNGIKRIDRLKGNSAGTAAGGRGAEEQQLPLHTVDNPDFYIIVVPDMVGGRLTPHDKDVLAQAHKLIAGGSGAVLAVVFGTVKEDKFELAGVDQLMHFDDERFDTYCPEAKLAALVQIEKLYAPQHWLFPDSIHGGSDLGSRLSARLGERPAVQAWQVEGNVTVARGAAGATDIQRETPRILLLAAECADPMEDQRYQAKALETPELPAVLSRLEDLGQVDVDPNAIALAEAEFIFSGGNGVKNWELFHETAAALGATEGASRVAVDDGFMPRFRQVGATGTWVTARVYIAVGISGAIQHMQGIGQVEKLVAINLDAGCDMVKGAALSAVGDSEEIMKALLELVRDYRAQKAGGQDAA